MAKVKYPTQKELLEVLELRVVEGRYDLIMEE